MFVYLDGMPVDTLRAEDFGNQPDWAVENGSVEDNLLKNPGFEKEHGDTISGSYREVEGWQLSPFDQYNCSYFVVNQEINNELDKDNHIMLGVSPERIDQIARMLPMGQVDRPGWDWSTFVEFGAGSVEAVPLTFIQDPESGRKLVYDFVVVACK